MAATQLATHCHTGVYRLDYLSLDGMGFTRSDRSSGVKTAWYRATGDWRVHCQQGCSDSGQATRSVKIQWFTAVRLNISQLQAILIQGQIGFCSSGGPLNSSQCGCVCDG